MSDSRIQQLIAVVEAMRQGQRELPSIPEGEDELAYLGRSLNALADYLYGEIAQQQILSQIMEKINQGLTLDEVLNYSYDALKSIIPFDRIGFSLIAEDGNKVTAVWSRSEEGKVFLTSGYSAPLAGSSLERIISTGEPRILNDLAQYSHEKPQSESTRLIVAEGLRSSLTCPLVAMGKPIGFMFFTSRQPYAYAHVHVDLFLRIARQLSLIAEKGRLYQRVLELNDVKNKFIGMAAHDLRTPIAVIKGHLDLFTDRITGDINEAQEKSIKTMTSLCGRMLNLIEAFLDISAIESGQLVLKKEEVNVGQYLAEVVDFNRPFALRKKIDLRLALPDDLPLMALDRSRIGQVLNNLISNALKFSPPQTVVTVQAMAVNQEVQIAVQDQGPGIPESERSKIFAYFGKTSVRPTGGESSTGLGLAIAKKIVDAHGGKIWLESFPGKGAIFYFSLPRI